MVNNYIISTCSIEYMSNKKTMKNMEINLDWQGWASTESSRLVGEQRNDMAPIVLRENILLLGGLDNTNQAF